MTDEQKVTLIEEMRALLTERTEHMNKVRSLMLRGFGPDAEFSFKDLVGDQTALCFQLMICCDRLLFAGAAKTPFVPFFQDLADDVVKYYRQWANEPDNPLAIQVVPDQEPGEGGDDAEDYAKWFEKNDLLH